MPGAAERSQSSACKSTACSGSIDRVDYLYDGSGHRTQIKETTSAGAVSTTDVVYQGDTVVQDLLTDATHPPKTLVRTYATDDTGRIVEVCDPDCATGTVYVVVYNGHGDATGLWKHEASGALTLANSYTYSTWGTPHDDRRRRLQRPEVPLPLRRRVRRPVGCELWAEPRQRCTPATTARPLAAQDGSDYALTSRLDATTSRDSWSSGAAPP